MPPPRYSQPTLAEAGTLLREVTFAVLDLETTGQPPDGTGITEIGAVKVRGGEVIGEFATLVNPGAPIPPLITVLTGITEAMVAPAPCIEQVLPTLLEFLHGAVLVAHNAPFDIGHMKAACQRYGYRWPSPPVVDTAALARRVLVRDEVPNHQLATLARYFRTQTTPIHRALDDARATVEVLHALIGRLGSFHVFTLEETIEFAKAISPEQRRKRHLARGLPDAPGVYLFRDANDRVLYVGTSGSIATRVRSYFTASETRKRISEMLHAAQRVEAVVCAHRLEAEVRELRLIGGAKPRYNRRSRFPEKVFWLKLTQEAFPRLSIVREVKDDGAAYLGPFSSTRQADDARIALHEAVPLRQCQQPISVRTRRSACVLHEMGRCGAPCEGKQSQADYMALAEAARRAMTLDATPVFSAVAARMERLSVEQRYEEASVDRDRLAAFVRTAARMQRLEAVTRIPHLVAASPAFDGGWDIHVIRYGRLAAAGVMPRGAHPKPFVESLTATAEVVIPGPGPVHAASAEETECILRWLESPGVRLVEIDGEWSLPAHGAARHKARIERAYQGLDRARSREGRPLR